MAFDTEALTTTIDRAVAQFQQEEARLYQGGSPIYAEAVHEQRLARLVEDLHRAAEGVDAQVEAELRAVDRLIEAQQADPLQGLSEAELRRASSLQGFVREDALDAPLPDVLRQVRAVLAAPTPDKVSAALWLRYARQRIARDNERGKRSDPDLQATATLDELLGELARLVAPAGALTPAQATSRRLAARKVRTHAHERVSAADGTQERIRREMAASGRYGF